MSHGYEDTEEYRLEKAWNIGERSGAAWVLYNLLRGAVDGKRHKISDLAAKSKVSRAYINEILAGHIRQPGIDKLQAIATYFSVPPSAVAAAIVALETEEADRDEVLDTLRLLPLAFPAISRIYHLAAYLALERSAGPRAMERDLSKILARHDEARRFAKEVVSEMLRVTYRDLGRQIDEIDAARRQDQSRNWERASERLMDPHWTGGVADVWDPAASREE